MIPAVWILYRPTDERRCRQLRLKAAEYQGRLNLREIELLNGNPFLSLEHIKYNRLRILMIERLLADGKVELRALYDELIKKDELVPSECKLYLASFLVVRDYVLTGGQNISGGTGLPNVG